ncbi:Large ribosomal RNA subunit accumulation protein YCED homolog 1, chloroplastic-like protein [Drosera capensis]
MSLLSCPCSVNAIPKFCSKTLYGPCHLKLHNIPAVCTNPIGYKHVATNFLKSKEGKIPSYSKILPVRNKAKASNDEGSFEEEEDYVYLDWGDEDDEETPWEGALVYKRSALTPHLECCTTLERLGLGKLSSEVSKKKAASLLGLRVTESVEDHGTPVLVSFDVTKKRKRLRLDGVIKTVITLDCYMCAKPAANDICLNFSLLLTEDPVPEDEMIDMGEIYEEHGAKGSRDLDMEGEFEDNDDSIYLDDRLYFPPDQKEVDISKPIRDMLHLEIRVDAVCDPACKGLCLSCGANLNSESCECTQLDEEGEDEEGASYRPMENLRQLLLKKYSR